MVVNESIMNKTQLVEAIASEAKLTRSEAKRALDAFLKVTGDVLSSGGKISLLGFGSFSVSKNPARTGRNFKTGAPVRIAARKVVKFRPGMELSARVD